MASEEMLFDNNVDDGRGRRTTDACLYYKLTYEPLAQGSSELKIVILRESGGYGPLGNIIHPGCYSIYSFYKYYANKKLTA